MKGQLDQVWVTSAVDDAEVEKALLLYFSLKRTYTTRKVAVILSPQISPDFRRVLKECFDLVFEIDEGITPGKVTSPDFAKLYSLFALRSFEKCVYLSPSIMALQNADDIFKTKEPLAADGTRAVSVFLFAPSAFNYEAVKPKLKNFLQNGTRFESYLKDVGTSGLGKLRIPVIDGDQILKSDCKITLVNCEKFSKEKDITSLQRSSILNKLVVDLWLNIRQTMVFPWLNHQIDTITQVYPQGYAKEPIAIVGMSCRYPGSANLEEFWNLLAAGGDGTGPPPEFRWLKEHCPKICADARKTNAGFLKSPVDEFDAKFFGIAPMEATFMDPQHRLLHELVWEALEDACMDPHSLKGTSGSVFIGSWLNDYGDILTASAGGSEFYRKYMGNSIGAAAARISFLLEMTGPSVATESGCSSAMVAVHMACKSLQNGETDAALACGVNLLLHQFNKDVMPMVISPDGYCKTFSEDANGFARAEGAGVLVLKRLSDAIKQGDHIWGLIRGSAISQEGVSKSMGTPTVHCESLAMQEALYDAVVSPEEVTYVEAHGTGTVVGDPMEVAAIAKAYHSPNRKEPLIIGSVKTNVGHTESCSGITGIMKVILAMQNERIPAHRNFTKLNPSIDLGAVPAVIPLESMPWKKCAGKPRIAGVSSFGITGTDGHVIVEEPTLVDYKNTFAIESIEDMPLHILKLSAKTDEAMDLLLTKYQDHLQQSTDDIKDICHSANTGRANFPVRSTILAKNTREMCEAIQSKKYIRGEVKPGLGKICFLFTGQGSQYPGMARTLYQSSPVFQMHFDFCANFLATQYGINISDVLWDSKGQNSKLDRTIYSQTSIFCVEYALQKVWESWGVKPEYVLGHSLGEFAAAVCAGIISVEDALKLVAERSGLIDGLAQGKMLVIRADFQKVATLMKHFAGGNANKTLDYAAINSNEQTVVAGDSDVVLEFSEFCKNNNTKCIILAATHAFHSKHMDPILEAYGKVADTVENTWIPEDSKCCYISGMRGDLVSADHVDSKYWVDHTREKVRFVEASKKAVELGCRIFIEIGPQPVLTALTMTNNDQPLNCFPSLKRNEENWSTLLTSLGKLYIHGVDIDWSGLDLYSKVNKVRLPHYPFLGKKFWPQIESSGNSEIHPLVGSQLLNPTSSKLFQVGLSASSHDWIVDHAIGHNVIFPGAGYLEMCLVAGYTATQGCADNLEKPSRPIAISNLNILAPMALETTRSHQLQTMVDYSNASPGGESNGEIMVKIFRKMDSNSSKEWLQHADATFSPVVSSNELNAVTNNIEHVLKTATNNDDMVHQMYEKLASLGLKFGPAFRSIEKVWTETSANSRGNIILTKIKIPSEDPQYPQYLVHPVILDAMIQSIILLKLAGNLKKKLYVPIKIGQFIWVSALPDSAEDLYIRAYDQNGENASSDWQLSTASCSASLVNSTGKIFAVMSSVEFIDTTARALESVLEQQNTTMPELYEETWIPDGSQREDFISPETHDKVIKTLVEHGITENLKQYNNRKDLIDTFEKLDELVYYNILRALYDCGWKTEKNEIFQQNELMSRLSIDQQYDKQMRYFLNILKEEDILEKIEGVETTSWKVTNMPPSLELIRNKLDCSTFVPNLAQRFDSTRLLAKIGASLGSILRGENSVLPIMFPEDNQENREPSAAQFYVDHGNLLDTYALGKKAINIFIRGCKQEIGDKKHKFRVVEIGAGTGAYASAILSILEDANIEYEYTYTDISSAFFPAAEKKFERYAKNLKFKKLDIEGDILSQGFIPAYYDYVCASHVVHATKNLRDTLSNIATLLKPRGVFNLVELSRVDRVSTFPFGLLDGFWRFEDVDVRPDHCALTKTGWNAVLEQHGFEVAAVYPCGLDTHTHFFCQRAPILEPKTLNQNELVKHWIIFCPGENQVSDFLKVQISQLPGRKFIQVIRGDKFEMEEPSKVTLRPNEEENFVNLLKNVNTNFGVIEGIVYCWSLDTSRTTQDDILRPYFYIAKALGDLKQPTLPRLCALTQGSVPIEDNDISNFHFSTLWGFTKTLQNEQSDLSCKCIDIGPMESGGNGMLQLFHEIMRNDKLTQVGFSHNVRHIPKFISHKLQLHDLKIHPGIEKFQLILPETKSISDLKFGTLDAATLGEGEIEIQVKSSALNFKDVLSVLKPSDDFKDSNAVGFDFAGVVKQVHPHVTKWQVGDSVFGVNFNGNALPSHITLHEDDVLPVPDHMTLTEACTLPAVVTTSYYCLIDVAKITKSDTVLIHTASGGVGLTAIQICKHIGCTIIATAGSPRKQNYLRSLGIQHVFHSRNTSYSEDILKATNGRGVTMVLNSLTSEGFKEATLKACAEGARFVEMSKLSIWTLEEMKALRPDVVYSIVDVSCLGQAETRRLMQKVSELSDTKVVSPIPYVQFHGVNIREALQYLQKAKHIGKVVCLMPEMRQASDKMRVYTPLFNNRSTYLITGGLGGIGFEVGKWMVQMGAKYVLLAGRRSLGSQVGQEIRQLNNLYGSCIQTIQLDVGNYDQCKNVIRKDISEMRLPKLRGVMHCAGTLEDGLILNQSWTTLSSTFNAKISGTLNLHRATKYVDLEHFVLFSSSACLFGSPGQSNHAAGNNFEDSFAFYRRSVGLPATTINWGPWSEVGVATEVDLPGVRSMSTLQGMAALEYILKSQRVQTCVTNVDSFAILSKVFPHVTSYLDDRLLQLSGNSSSSAKTISSEEFWQKYDSSQNRTEKIDVLRDTLCLILRNILRLEDSDVVDPNANLQEMGVDSLMFVEIKNAIQSLFENRATVSASAVRDCTTVDLLSATLVKIVEREDSVEEKPLSSDEIDALIKKDCLLPETIRAHPNQSLTPTNQISSLLVTGCTGTLGPYILKQLSNRPQISEIFCLIRSSKTMSGKQRLLDILSKRDILKDINVEKLSIIEGNVHQHEFGLSHAKWEQLANKVEGVIHCAAKVSHMERYGEQTSQDDIRTVNVEGTKRVLEFACAGNKLKHIYYASTLLAVASVDENGDFLENWQQSEEYNGVTTLAYPITKFVGDILMKTAQQERGIPVKAFRFPFVVGDSKTGRFVLNDNHLMMRYIFILKYGVMPSNPFPIAALPVDICANVSLELFWNSEVPNDVYNICNVGPDMDQEFVRVADKMGRHVEIVELSDFIKKIDDETKGNSPFSVFKDFYANDEDLLKHYSTSPAMHHWMVEGGSKRGFLVSKKIKKYYPEFYQAESTMDHIFRDLMFAKSEGWLDKYLGEL